MFCIENIEWIPHMLEFDVNGILEFVPKEKKGKEV